MSLSLDVLLTQIWPLALAGLVLALFVRGWNRRGRTIGPGRQARQGPPSGASVSAPLSGRPSFSGTTHGIAWTLEVGELPAEADAGLLNRRVNAEYWTRWHSTDCALPQGALLLMNPPKGGMPRQFDLPQGGGLFASMALKAADLALGLYLRQRFGPERAAGLQAGQHAALTDDPIFLCYPGASRAGGQCAGVTVGPFSALAAMIFSTM